MPGADKAQRLVGDNTNKGGAPDGIKRIDIPKTDPNGNPLHGQQSHAHLTDKRAVNQDGSFKHGSGDIMKTITDWLSSHGWKL